MATSLFRMAGRAAGRMHSGLQPAGVLTRSLSTLGTSHNGWMTLDSTAMSLRATGFGIDNKRSFANPVHLSISIDGNHVDIPLSIEAQAALRDSLTGKTDFSAEEAEIEARRNKIKPKQDELAKMHVAAERTSRAMIWGGLGAWAAQIGLFARLTWWEYSWDIMEPITYFYTVGCTLSGGIFYVFLRRNNDYHDLHELLWHRSYNKRAKAAGINIEEVEAEAAAIEKDAEALELRKRVMK